MQNCCEKRFQVRASDYFQLIIVEPCCAHWRSCMGLSVAPFQATAGSWSLAAHVTGLGY